MGMIPSNLCILIEQLEDARQFHELAAEVSDGTQHKLHHDQAQGYAAMLLEIRRWKSHARQRDESPDSDADLDEVDQTGSSDDYFALLDRVYHMHRAVAPIARAIQIRATGAAMDGEATEGRRRAGTG